MNLKPIMKRYSGLSAVEKRDILHHFKSQRSIKQNANEKGYQCNKRIISAITVKNANHDYLTNFLFKLCLRFLLYFYEYVLFFHFINIWANIIITINCGREIKIQILIQVYFVTIARTKTRTYRRTEARNTWSIWSIWYWWFRHDWCKRAQGIIRSIFYLFLQICLIRNKLFAGCRVPRYPKHFGILKFLPWWIISNFVIDFSILLMPSLSLACYFKSYDW